MSTLAIPRRKPARTFASKSSVAFPLLETGYHLTQPEFHRRYELMPDVKKAELVEGVVFMGPPLSKAHADATALHEKLSVYRRSGAREYLVWSLPDSQWFNFESGEAERLSPARNGFLCSRVFSGLWLDVAGMTAGVLKRISASVRRGLATVDRAAFVKKLSAAR